MKLLFILLFTTQMFGQTLLLFSSSTSNLGDELVLGAFTNESSFGFETFTNSGVDISSAINTTGFGIAYYLTTESWAIGDSVLIIMDVVLNSGATTFRLGKATSSAASLQQTIVNGHNEFVVSATQTAASGYLLFWTDNGTAVNFSASNISAKKYK